MGRHATLFVIGLLALVSSLAAAQDVRISSQSEIDWQRGTLRVSIEAVAIEGQTIQPGFLHRANEQINAAFPAALFDSLLSLRVDSVDLVRDIVRERPGIASRVTELSRISVPGLSKPRPDMSGVHRDFDVPIFPDFVRLFVDHSIPFRMEEVISWVPTTEYTGVVIYAADPLPLRGTDQRVYPAPALFPEIYDESLRPVLERDMVDPEAIRRRGVVAYSGNTDEDPWRDRIGGNPIRIMAREAYGIYPTDLVIGAEDADRLLASAHNRNLLRTGRILVILDESQIRSDADSATPGN